MSLAGTCSGTQGHQEGGRRDDFPSGLRLALCSEFLQGWREGEQEGQIASGSKGRHN